MNISSAGGLDADSSTYLLNHKPSESMRKKDERPRFGIVFASDPESRE
jgi:hypothetical protein